MINESQCIEQEAPWHRWCSRILYIPMFQLVSVTDPYFAIFHIEQSHVVQQRWRQSKFEKARNRRPKQVTNFEGNSLKQLLWSTGVVLGSIARLIVRTILPINTFAGDFPLSLGWTLILLLILPFLSPLLFLSRLISMCPQNFQLDHSIGDDREETVYVLLHGSCSIH